MNDLSELCVAITDSIRAVMLRIDRGSRGLALVVDDQNRFLATITDGDVRRAILQGVSLDAPAFEAIKGAAGQLRQSITATADTSREEQLRLMLLHDIRHLPLLDSAGRIVELAIPTVDDEQFELPVQAVIMAGGFGKRLRPLTDHTPKPMLCVGGQPLMERTIRSLHHAGIRRINVTTHYMPEKITEYFGTGSQLGVKLNYVSEDEPLGTAGAISLMDDSDEPLLVMNGDIFTRVNYRDLISFHQKRRVALTVGVRQYEIEVPYGVIEASLGEVRSLREKPKYSFMVNAGVYMLEPVARRRIPLNQKYNMTDLIENLLAEGMAVACFPIIEYWMDIGRHDDLERAQHEAQQVKRAA